MMRKRGARWLGYITENIAYKGMALFAAVALWALVATEPELSTFVNVRVEYKNLPDELELASEPVTNVLLELRGPSGELRGIGDGGQRPAVVLDMSNVVPGRRTFVIDSSNVPLARGVHVVQTTPSELSFTFDRRAMRTVPVVVRLTGEGHAGYTAVATHADPQELMIVGPASHVNKVTQVETDPVDVSSVFGVKQFRVTATVSDPFVRFAASPQVAVTVTMKKI